MKLAWSEVEGITWRGPEIDDFEILQELPDSLVEGLRELNGFVLHGGALHVRGACAWPEWHSLDFAMRGKAAFHELYETVLPSDIPFAQDLYGDQFLLRDEQVWRLFAETGELESMAGNLEEFWDGVKSNFTTYLNVDAAELEPGQLLLAYPPFCFEEAGLTVELSTVPAAEAIQFHARLALQLKDIPEGAKIKFNLD